MSQSTERVYDIEAAIEAFKKGKPVIIMDDEERENEGDICLPAEFVTPEFVFFAKQNSGRVCVSINPLRAEELNLTPMTSNNTDPNGTPFTITVDLDSKYGITTGVSTSDLSKTIKALADLSYKAEDFTRPGHVDPLKASPLGLRGRQGHTESSVDLCKLAGVYPACLIAELMYVEGEKKGQMMRADGCIEFGRKWNMPIVRIKDILERLPSPEADLPVKVDDNICEDTKIKVYNDGKINYCVLIKGDPSGKENVFFRAHSECLTGDVFKSQRCDCYSQLQKGLKLLSESTDGILVYIRGHEGRGIGLEHKIQAYALQQTGNFDTVSANNELYLPTECRNYNYLPFILDDLKIKSVVLHSNNPDKLSSIKKYVSRVQPFLGEKTKFNEKYLEVKAEKLHNKPKRRIGLVYGNTWHKEKMNHMVEQVRKFFANNKEFELIEKTVPAAFELVMGSSTLMDCDCKAVIALGILRKGDTHHYEYIADAVSKGLMDLQIRTKIPVIYGLLTCLNDQQIDDRVTGPKNAVDDWCRAATEMAVE